MLSRSPTLNNINKDNSVIYNSNNQNKDSIILEHELNNSYDYEVQDESYHYLLNTKFEDINIQNSSTLNLN